MFLIECILCCLYVKYFRELQSLLQQFIIVEHAVEPAMDPSGEGIEGQLVDPQALVGQPEMDPSVDDPQTMEASGLVMSLEPSEAVEPIGIEPTELVEPSELGEPTELGDPVAMETSADDQMALEQNDAEAVAADDMVMVPVDECQPTDA
jgi:hypothetical protein